MQKPLQNEEAWQRCSACKYDICTACAIAKRCVVHCLLLCVGDLKHGLERNTRRATATGGSKHSTMIRIHSLRNLFLYVFERLRCQARANSARAIQIILFIQSFLDLRARWLSFPDDKVPNGIVCKELYGGVRDSLDDVQT